jgi:excisionase family DNA binding protein
MNTQPNAPTAPSRLLSIAAAAHALAVSERHVRGLIERGEIRSVRLGRRVLVAITELDRIVSGQRP